MMHITRTSYHIASKLISNYYIYILYLHITSSWSCCFCFSFTPNLQTSHKMAENGITDPLLPPSSSSDHLILNLSEPQPDPQPHRSTTPSRSGSPNPFRFIGCGNGPTVPPPTTVDPFRNGTPTVEGLYELLKIVACLPLALVRVVVFGACLMVGYVATKVALAGWMEKENPMPRWRCRVMWVTRICTRCILFSFG